MQGQRRRVLHLLSQRPSLTGSGITLDATVLHASRAGWQQAVVIGLPEEEAIPTVGGLVQGHIFPLRFGGPRLPFALPGMSDVMPYRSTVFSSMSAEALDTYREAWRAHLVHVINAFKPDLIHSHHVWVLSSLIKSALSDCGMNVPVVTHCHATGLRQMELTPHLATEVRKGCARNEAFVVLHHGHAEALTEKLALAANRVHVVSAGYRADLFQTEHDRANQEDDLLYVGKFSAAKGLAQLLDAFESLQRKRGSLRLHIAGSAASEEGDALRRRMETMSPGVVLHGALSQTALAGLMRRCGLLVLPSLYEGLPLVLVEAYASGCKLVATALPGVVEQLKPHLGAALELIPLPQMISLDRAAPEGLAAFGEDIAVAIENALGRPVPVAQASKLEAFTWQAVFRRIEAVWNAVLAA